jgi:hypothetical protein
MTNVTRSTDPAAARPASPGAEKPVGETKGDFEKLLEAKKDSRREAQPEAPGTGQGGHDAAAGSLLGRRERPDEGGSGSGGGQGQGGQDAPKEQPVRALPGDVAMATPIRWEPAPAAAAPARSAEMAARIEQIAQQIVQTAEVRLGPSGGAEARLELNLGALGNVHVSVVRGEDGALRIAFENASTQAGEALTTHATELLERLETRGLPVQEITVQGADQADFRLAPTRHAEGGSGADAEAREGRRQQGFEDQRQKRRDQEAAIPGDEDA